jgi:hypothetical protein
MLLVDSLNQKFASSSMPVLNLAQNRFIIFGKPFTSKDIDMQHSGLRAVELIGVCSHSDKNLGGACGEIHAMLKSGKKLLNPLVAAQK